MNENIFSGKWNEFKGEIQQGWGQLTGDELDRTNGNITAIGGLLEQKYGQLKEEAKSKLNELIAKYRGEQAPETQTEVKAQGVMSEIADKTEEAKADLKNAIDGSTSDDSSALH